MTPFRIEKLQIEKEALLLELEGSKQTLSNRDVKRELRVLKEVVHSLEVRTTVRNLFYYNYCKIVQILFVSA